MKKFLSILLIAILVITQIPITGFAEGDNGFPPIPPPRTEEPKLFVTSDKTFNGESGDTINIPITVENNSLDPAYNISVLAEIDSPKAVYIEGSGFSSISSLNPSRSRKVSFNVKIDKAAENDTYPVRIKVVYENYTGNKYETTDTIYVRVANKAVSTSLTINRVDLMPANNINAGNSVVVGFEIENKGTAPAKDIKLSLSGLSNDGFTVARGLNNKTVQSLAPGKKSYIYFDLISSTRLAAGSHELTMDLTYKDMKNQEIKDESKFFIGVNSNKGKNSSLIIQNISYPTGSIGQNQDVNVNFDLRNQGQINAKNIVITAESKDPSGLVPKSVSTIKLNSLAPGATQKINFVFLTTKGGETKNYPIDINVEYVDDLSPAGEKYNLNQFVGVFAVAPEVKDPVDPIKTTPKLIIDKYDFDPGLVRAGENFQMHLSFFNTNSKKSVKNIKIFLTAEANTGSDPNSPSAGSSVFTPVDSSNTFYIDSIPPKGNVQKTITMFTVPDAVAKTHTITANFEYEDTAGESYTATELIGVPVIQQSRLEVGELNYYPEAFLGEPVPISLEFYNTGKVPLYNMMVKLEGNFQTEGGSSYIGNFDNGSSEYFEGMVIPNQPGLLEGEVVFTYEDSTGEPQELRRDFSLNVMDAPPMDEFPGEFPPEDEGGGIKGLLKSKGLWITLILLAASGGGFFFYKKKKKEKEFALDE